MTNPSFFEPKRSDQSPPSQTGMAAMPLLAFPLLLLLVAAHSTCADSPSSLRGNVVHLSSLSSRVPGYPGNKQAEAWVALKFRESGVQQVSLQPFSIGVPVESAIQPPTLTLGNGASFRLHCLWPNGVRTPTTPPQGLSGQLLYARRGEYADFDGHDVKGRLVLLDFNSDDNWIHAFELGAKAVVFIEPERTTRFEAERKLVSVPLDAPRYWISREDAGTLRSLRQDLQLEATIHARMEWRNVQLNNVVGVIRGTDPKLKNQYVILSAHFDSVSMIPALSPGAESASSIAAMLEVAREFVKHPPRRTVVFLATNAHYLGMGGMAYFVRGFHLAKTAGVLPPDLDGKKKRTKALLAPYKLLMPALAKDKASLLITLDLASQSKQIGLFCRGGYEDNRDIYHERHYSAAGHLITNKATEAARSLGLSPTEVYADAINPAKGRTADSYFPEMPPFESEVMSFTSPALALATCNDVRNVVDTPHDTADRINWDNLEKQVALLKRLLPAVVKDPSLSMQIEETPRVYGPLFGRMVEWDPTRSFVPDKPVMNSVVIARPWVGDRGQFMVGFPRPLYGVHCEQVAVTDRNAKFELLAFQWPARVRLDGFALDPATQGIAYSYDQGGEGEQKYAFRSIDMPSAAGKLVSYVLFRCAAVGVADLVDPRYLVSLQSINLIDADLENPPHMFGIATGIVRPYDLSTVEPCAVLFVQPETRLKLTMSLGLIGNRLVLINASPRKPQGTGFTITKNVLLANLADQIAGDLWFLDDYRMRLLARYGIRSERLDELHRQAHESARKSRECAQQRQWSKSVLLARQSWALESSIYPDIIKTANDVVKAVLFYLFLVVPFSYFAERLLFGFPDIRKQIVGVSVIFTLVLTTLAFVHPAFKITLTPFLIFLAFVIVGLSLLVIALVLLKFNEELRRFRGGMYGVHHADVNRLGAMTAALNLGIANMRRRPVRTVLTCVTLVLLTFTVLSFTSLKSYVRFNTFEMPWQAPYAGVFYRHLDWSPLEESEYQRFVAELGEDFTLAPRYWRISPRIDEFMSTEARSEDGREAIDIDAVVGLSADERLIFPVEKCLIRGRWFEEDEKSACLVSSAVAKSLGLNPAGDLDGSIRLFGEKLNVVGLFETRKMDALTGLAEEHFSPANFQLLRPKVTQIKEGSAAASAAMEKFIYFSSQNVLFVPAEFLRQHGGDLRAVLGVPKTGLSRRLQTGEVDLTRHLRDLMRRWAVVLFVGEKGKARLFSSIGSTSVTGMGDLFVPILIAALIVLNTMLGSVYERTREISVYSSIGLSPLHTASLFVAESCVYATIGAISGYLIGQLLGKVITTYHLLPGLMLNYSSGSAVLTIALVMVVMLLSTIYPAYCAMKLAVPDLGTSWQLGEPTGDHWSFRLPFQVADTQALALCTFMREFLAAHSEAAIGSFYTEEVRLEETGESPRRVPHYGVAFRAWLAPYDFGISQHARLQTVPSVDETTYEFLLEVQRISGDVPSWKRANRAFLNRIRKQLLVWRTVKLEDRQYYTERGGDLLPRR
ncbi:MAG: M28 family peptidase [Armatimonadetes bacterium]|nr:M28 family peptidase [Armatimonadota bacterium]